MKMKRLLSLLCALMLLSGVFPAHAEDPVIPEFLYYQGGVVLRSIPRGTQDSELLQLGYTLTDTPYIILGQPYTWDVFISGGTAPYTCYALLAYKPFEQGEFEEGTQWQTAEYFLLNGTSFSYTFTTEGRYFWEFRVTDAAGQKLNFQTRMYETYVPADESDETTLVGKVNSIIDALITDDMSDYTRARVLHDWIIYNANYDYSDDPYRDASGVLLHQRGVCDSYARAYLMLCTAAGLECMYVSGTAGSDAKGWGPHGWNLVKLGGSWYHVDCTWDDPDEGGYERHTYFCVDDETLAKDHRWNQPDDIVDKDGMLVPDATGGAYEAGDGALGDYDFTFATIAEYDAGFDALVASGVHLTVTKGLYTGTEDAATVWALFQEWGNTQYSELRQANLVNGGQFQTNGINIFGLMLNWNTPTDYLRIDDTNLVVTLNTQVTIVPSEISGDPGTFTWTSSDPSVATVSAVQSGTDIAATVTGVHTGTATITVTSADGITDSLTATVVEAYQPDFNLKLSKDANGILVDWDGIPGATNYIVMRRCNGVETQLASQSEVDVYIPESKLPANVRQEVYVIAQRNVGGSDLTYTSKAVTYGTLTINYAATLPASSAIIGDEAFLGAGLTTVYIPDGVTTIGADAFSACTGLTAVRFPASLTSIADDAFSGCPIQYVECEDSAYILEWVATHLPDAELIP